MDLNQNKAVYDCPSPILTYLQRRCAICGDYFAIVEA
jgi:hypothetical protein